MKKFKIKIFADGADEKQMFYCNKQMLVSGLTTNPSLMKKSGIKNYENFAKNILKKIKKKNISFEVFSDDIYEMYNQAKKINNWGKNIFVKIPVSNSKGKSTYSLIKKLSAEGVKLNVTAVFTLDQVKNVFKSLSPKTESIISIFCGRIADTGVDPKNIIKKSLKICKKNKKIKILWASTRELFNIIEAEQCKCHIITVPKDILNKIKLIGYDLKKYSKETVKSFYLDAKKSGYKI